jgi:hypothetical protein
VQTERCSRTRRIHRFNVLFAESHAAFEPTGRTTYEAGECAIRSRRLACRQSDCVRHRGELTKQSCCARHGRVRRVARTTAPEAESRDQRALFEAVIIAAPSADSRLAGRIPGRTVSHSGLRHSANLELAFEAPSVISPDHPRCGARPDCTAVEAEAEADGSVVAPVRSGLWCCRGSPRSRRR